SMATRLLRMLIPLAMVGLAGCGGSTPTSGPLQVVGAENFYGDLLHQIGGNRVTVSTVINSPTTDPHEYEPTTKDAVAVSQASLVLMNGLGYDSWMTHLLDSSPSSSRSVIVAGDVAHASPGSNPHLWYRVPVMERLAGKIASALGKSRPSDAAYFRHNAGLFRQRLRPLLDEMNRIRQSFRGARIEATESVFNYMARSLGLRFDEAAFQHAVEEGIDPSARAVISFRSMLQKHRVRALIYNKQAVEPITQNMEALARAEGIPVVGVTETEPAGTDYQHWMLGQLRELARDLRRKEQQ
ncbi:MAG: metal ABC transporter solute-binding protein, Zn/Mn family, partial [Chloroflexota bacterium]